MFKEFREFLLRGNVVDLAVAVVIGAAFGALITSFTANILTPLLGLIGVPEFSQLAITTPGGAVLEVGLFLNSVVAFILVAAAIFFSSSSRSTRSRLGASAAPTRHRPPRPAPSARARSPWSPAAARTAPSRNRRAKPGSAPALLVANSCLLRPPSRNKRDLAPSALDGRVCQSTNHRWRTRGLPLEGA
jgi:large conductance mechanosensitive channel protein